MKVYAPDYYLDFRCKAGACQHTCCEGWEIDIDPKSLTRFQSFTGHFGRKLRDCISLEPEPHFVLLPGERCPMLREDNLCELILQKGEESLCQICADHPRFRNYWSDRIEIGLGLACEEAGRLILTSDHSLRLVEIGEDFSEQEAEPEEDELWLREYRGQLIAKVRGNGPATRLREYLIYRHIADALYDGRLEEREKFIDAACESILRRWDGEKIEDLIEHARIFSNEIEYDDERLNEMIMGAK